MSSSVTVRSCCRVDLAGGTLDIWPLGLLHDGARTVNVAVDLPVEVSITPNPAGTWAVFQGETRVAEAGDPRALAADPEGALAGQVAQALDLPPVSVHLASGSPRGGGLGASSALMVALIRAAEALTGTSERTAAQVVRLARDLEARMMNLPTGLQDHYPALLGGVLDIAYQPGGETVERIEVDLDVLGDSMVVAYSGQSHFSAGSNWQVIRRRLDGEEALVGLFERLVEAATAMARALAAGDLPAAGRALGDEWAARRQLAPGVSTPTVEAMLDAAGTAGAWGGKVCGAGGGGSVVVLAPPERRSAVAAALVAAGGEVLAARPTAAGAEFFGGSPPSPTPLNP